MRSILSTLILLLAALLPLPAQDKPAGSEDKKDTNAPALADSQMNIPIPLNVPAKGVKIPYFGPDNKLQMMFEAEVATKLDETHIEMQNLKIEVYNTDNSKFYIELPQSLFNMENRVLTGEQSVTIRRDDFEILGDAVEFHTKERFGKILGKVKMTILSTDRLEKP